MSYRFNLPISATPRYVLFSGVAGALSAAVCIAFLSIPPLAGTIILLLACAAPMWWLEKRRFPLSTATSNPIAGWRRKLRLLGIAAILMLFWLVYIFVSFILSIFHQPDVLSDMLLILLVATVPWMSWILWRRPRKGRLDSIELFGSGVLIALCKKSKFQNRHRQAFLGWCVKAYFLPLMLGSCYLFVVAAGLQFMHEQVKWAVLFTSVFYFLYAIDTAFGTIGYCSTSRRINAQIRSTDATALGWIVTLVCYPPLNVIVLGQWLAYKDGYEWDAWLDDQPLMLAVWGSLIFLLTTGYVWSTVSFGLRFSNLSYRGLVSSGPYRYFKHPSYLFKNISWWLISIPFISLHGGKVAIANCLGLLGINFIYALRAWTEERHLASDPDYRDYSEWMEKYGVLGRFRRLIGY